MAAQSGQCKLCPETNQLVRISFACGHSYHLGCYDNQYDGLPAASARTCRACPPPGPSGNSPARRRSVPVAAVATPAVKRKRRAEDAADSPVDDDLESSPLRPFRRRRMSGAEEDLAAARRYSQAQEEYTRLSKLHKQEAERDEGRSGQDLEQLEQDDQELDAFFKAYSSPYRPTPYSPLLLAAVASHEGRRAQLLTALRRWPKGGISQAEAVRRLYEEAKAEEEQAAAAAAQEAKEAQEAGEAREAEHPVGEAAEADDATPQ